MDSEKAYVFGLLHDIGRRFGVKHFGHIYDGYTYMTELGYDEVARICASHSFSVQRIEDYIGNFDVTPKQQKGDVKRRYGTYPQDKWDKNLGLKEYFSEKIGQDIYAVL